MARDFYKWLNTFTDTIRDSSYWVDWEKVLKNVNHYKDELNILNGLIGCENIEDEFRRIATKFPKTVECIPILIAVRSTQIKLESININFSVKNHNINEICKFMQECGLFKMLQEKAIKNLVDYLIGIEVGLDTNARKNRGGAAFENKFETFLKASKIEYFKEMTTDAIEKKFKIDLRPITNSGATLKRFDFVFKIEDIVYGVEVNFYSSNGSKLNETARSYKQIAQETQPLKGFKFMWITDGAGWNLQKII